jgi:hypothetical protein
LFLEQLAHQPQRPGVAPALNQHVEDLALVVDRTSASGQSWSIPRSRAA